MSIGSTRNMSSARSSPRAHDCSCCRRNWTLARRIPSRRALYRACCNCYATVFTTFYSISPTPLEPLAAEAFDHASRVYLVTDRSVHSTRQTIRMLRYIEDRDNNPQTSLLMNSPNAVTAGRVLSADFATAVGRNVLHEVQFEAKALSIAENLGEAPVDRSAGRVQPVHHPDRERSHGPARGRRAFAAR